MCWIVIPARLDHVLDRESPARVALFLPLLSVLITRRVFPILLQKMGVGLDGICVNLEERKLIVSLVCGFPVFALAGVNDPSSDDGVRYGRIIRGDPLVRLSARTRIVEEERNAHQETKPHPHFFFFFVADVVKNKINTSMRIAFFLSFLVVLGLAVPNP
jgi:hypothetical protein